MRLNFQLPPSFAILLLIILFNKPGIVFSQVAYNPDKTRLVIEPSPDNYEELNRFLLGIDRNYRSNYSSLEIRSDSIETIPTAVFPWENLSALILRMPRLSSLPYKVQRFKKLEYIYLQKTKISNLNAAIKRLEKLRTIVLDSAVGFDSVPDFSGFRKLKALHIYSTKISPKIKLPSSLEELVLTGAGFKALPVNLYKLKNLLLLDLSNNQLTSLPASIGSVSKVDVLQLNKNFLSSLPEEISLLKNLEIMEIEDNRLTTLPETLAKLPKLQKIYLAGNQIPETEQVRLQEIFKKIELVFEKLD